MLDITSQINDIVNEYTSEVKKAMLEASKEAAKDTVKELRATSPKGKGKKAGRYARGWAWKSEKDGYRVYNKTDYQLTHLLEKGHRIFINGKYTGKSTNPIPHIAPAERKGKELYIELVERKLNK